MKKIVGILAGAAVLASSVFAADISAGARLEGDLFNYNGVTEEAKAIMIKGANNPWNAPATFSISSDEAGATWKFTDNGADHTLKTCEYQIWFKPVDMLTVKVGKIAESMNTETIDWGGRVCNYDSFGYEVVYAQDALTIALGLVTGEGNYLFNNDKVALEKAYADAIDAKVNAKKQYGYIDPNEEKAIRKAGLTDDEKKAIREDKSKKYEAALGEINVYGAYAADFGTIKAMFDAKNTFKDNTIAVGYNNTFDSLTMFADAALTIKEVKSRDPKAKADDKMNDVGAAIDAFVQYNMDALTAKAYVKAAVGRFNNISKDYGDVDEDGNEVNAFTMDGNLGLTLIARVDYKLDPVNVFAYFKNGDLLKKAVKEGDTKKSNVFESTIKAGVNGSVGICNWECAAQIDTGKGAKFDKINFAVPVNFAVNF